MLAENVSCVAGGLQQEEFYLRKKLPWSLRCHRIAVVQPAQPRKGLNLAFTGRANFCCTTCWRVLRQSKMSPVLLVQVDNATPIVLNGEKSVTLGILGTTAW
jgi:hypothetical protein